MQGFCPNCDARLELPVSGAYQCERCHSRFEAFLATPTATVAAESASPPAAAAPPPALSAQPPATPAALATAMGLPPVEGACATHPDNPAITYCERCGDFICQLCYTPTEGRRYCPRCFDLLYQRGALSFTQRRFQKARLSIWLGVASILGLCMYCVPGLILGIIGLYQGVAALRDIDEHPDLPDRNLALAGIVLNAVSLLIAVVTLIVFVVMIFGAFR